MIQMWVWSTGCPCDSTICLITYVNLCPIKWPSSYRPKLIYMLLRKVGEISTMASQQKAHQPLHPSIRPILDPEYVQYHDSVLQFISPSENEPWDPSSRLKPSTTAAAAQGLIAVGSTVDRELSNIQIRQFTPTGCAPENGWPS